MLNHHESQKCSHDLQVKARMLECGTKVFFKEGSRSGGPLTYSQDVKWSYFALT